MSRPLKFIVICLGLLAIALSCGQADDRQTADTSRYDKLRRDMVEKQIKTRGITQSDVINAMLTVERHLFVPIEYRPFAYVDDPLPIGEDQTISQPYIVALMTQLLGLGPQDPPIPMEPPPHSPPPAMVITSSTPSPPTTPLTWKPKPPLRSQTPRWTPLVPLWPHSTLTTMIPTPPAPASLLAFPLLMLLKCASTTTVGLGLAGLGMPQLMPGI